MPTADEDVVRANELARAMTMSALLGRGDPDLNALCLEIMVEASADPDVGLVLLSLAHMAADGLAARVQLEALRGDPNAEGLIGRVFTIKAAVEAGVITS